MEVDANRGDIQRFVEVMFKHADEGTYVSIRTFKHTAGSPPVLINAVQLNGSGLGHLVQIAFNRARSAARYPDPVVFCPPVATFSNAQHAREEDLANGLALTVEIDEDARNGLAILCTLLGPPTAVVESGGMWTHPDTGVVQPKLHGHWRLEVPTRTPEEHALLKRLRRLATIRVGGDATNIPVSHPIRWPGSVHRKGKPKLARLVEVSDGAEIDLHAALMALELACAPRGEGFSGAAPRLAIAAPSETSDLVAEIISGRSYTLSLTSLSARYARDGMSKEKIAETLQGFMRSGAPELQEGEHAARWHSRYDGIYRMAASAVAKFGPNPEGSDTPQEEAPEAVSDPFLWPRPLAEEAYHGITGEIVRRLEPETESDPAGLLFQFLLAVGNVMGSGSYVVVESDRHPPRLDLVIVGRTSKGRKGSSWGRIKSLMETVAPSWVHACNVSGLSSGEGLIYYVRDARYEDVTDKKTGTTERKCVDQGVTDKRLLVFESEFARVLRTMERQGNTLSSILRDAWDSGNLRTIIKNAADRATGAHISVIGHITEDELRRYLNLTEMANGLANRLLFACAQRSKELARGGRPIDWTGIDQRLREVLIKPPRGEVGRTPAAWALWEAGYSNLSGDRPGMLGAIVGRAEAQVLRLALIYALLDGAREIDAPHMRAALACWKYAEDSARFIFGASLGDPVADEILRALQTRPEGMTRTELYQHFNKHQSSEQIGRALAVLARGNYAYSTTEKTAGRPIERWKVRGT